MISIILPVYNGERYISQSIDSVLNQTFTNFELLIAFNGTTDRSKEIVSRYHDERIRVFDFGKDKGKSKTLNKVLNESKYDFICLQDDDDVWIETKLERQIKYLYEYDVVGTMINYIDEYNNIISSPKLASTHEDILKWSFAGTNQVANTSAIFKAEDARRINGWNSQFEGVEDYDFWLRLMRNGKKFYNINERLVLHRLHNNSNFNKNSYTEKLINIHSSL